MGRKPRMTAKQIQFCDEYLANGLNATQAYQKVYNKTVNSYSAAGVGASELMKKPAVREYLDRVLAKLHDEKTMDAKEVLERLTSVARGEAEDPLINPKTGAVLSLRAPTKDQVRALELLGKAYGLFEKNVSLTLETPIFSGEDDIAE